MFGNVAVNQLQRVFDIKWHHAGQHLIKRNPQRIKIGPVIDGPIHPPGLFRRHVCQSAV